MNRINRIDALRGIAIIGVIFAHAGMLSTSTPKLFGIGMFGVQLFFLISGYIIAHVGSKEGFKVKEFYLKRFFRLAPLYYLVILICFIVGFDTILPFAGTHEPLNATNAIVHLTFLHGLFPNYLFSIYEVFWSLTPEIIFYLSFPFLLKRSTAFLISTLVIMVLLSSNSSELANGMYGKSQATLDWVNHSILSNGFLFIFGMLVYRCYGYFQSRKWLDTFVFCVFLMCIFGFYGINLSERLFTNQFYGYVTLIFPFLLHPKLKVLDNRSISYIGKISYSMFFVHFGVVILINKFMHEAIPYAIGVVLIISISIPLSHLTHIWIEKPYIKLGNKLINKRSKTITTVKATLS